MNKNIFSTVSWSKWYELQNADALNKITSNNEMKIELHSNKHGFVRRPTGNKNNPHYIFGGKSDAFGLHKNNGSRKLVKKSMIA